jgi:hypothetical protein
MDEPKRVPFKLEPGERPRDVMMKFVLDELGSLDAWKLLYDSQYKRHPSDLSRRERALTLILHLLWHLEAQEFQGRDR